MIWLGIDPGPRLTGWALIELDGGRPPRFVDGGHAPAEQAVQQLERASRVALEVLAPGLFSRDRYEGLIGTAIVQGGLQWQLRAIGARVIELTAGQWRADVVGSSSPTDPAIEAALRRRVTGLPAPPVIPAGKLVHVCDAVGVALAAAYQPGKQVTLALARGRR